MNRASLERRIPDIVRSIRDGRLTPSGYKLGDIKWRRKSYFVAVLDDPHSNLIQRNAFTFYLEGGSAQENYSFFDGVDIRILNNVTGFYCINRMISEDGDWPREKEEKYKVIANHVHRLHEDTGTNLGPPVPPP
jgi:hypothetical protein